MPNTRPRSREDLVAEAELKDAPEGRTIAKNISCKVYLPQQFGDMPYVEFLATEQLFHVISGRAVVSFRAEQRDGEELHSELVAYQLHLRNQTIRYWGKTNTSVTIDGVPERLLWIRHYERAKAPTTLYFRLSPNALLYPNHFRAGTPRGGVRVHPMKLQKYRLRADFVMELDERIRDVEEEREGETRSYVVRDLVAIAKSPVAITTIEGVSDQLRPLLDDFLLILSLATDCRTACIGWEYRDSNCHAEEFSGNFGFPTGEREHNFRWGLWERAKGPRSAFVRRAWRAFQASKDRSFLRSAIWVLIPGEDRPVTARFLTKFAVLEGFLQLQEHRRKRETVVPRADWNMLLPALEGAIDSIPLSRLPKMATKARRELKEKLPELNRPRPRASFDAFSRELQLDVSDLWPVFGTDTQPGLYQIRNKLIHGLQVPPSAEDALWTAERSLHWVVTRMLLRSWGWDTQQTAVRHVRNGSDEALRPESIAKAQAKLREALRSKQQ